ncbi:hypothetical protein TPB0596_31130 [Tsukamurella pulmonis]|uniref:hypothetical protein n=1 Tax=Tsukamurella pulmonis TaxID=47312 RepID=UPI001EDF252B|nr:hypothetical protein [Tsukamurella pulmonis]BDD83350.1 hypothetical protein TPB0596_31130 [Tsukamurella pulmonis]
MSSYRKLASELVIGDLVWRAGEYWKVEKVSPDEGKAIELDLIAKSGVRTTWAYRGDYDVAVGSRRGLQGTAAAE